MTTEFSIGAIRSRLPEECIECPLFENLASRYEASEGAEKDNLEELLSQHVIGAQVCLKPVWQRIEGSRDEEQYEHCGIDVGNVAPPVSSLDAKRKQKTEN